MNFLSVRRLDSLGRSGSMSSLNVSLDGIDSFNSSISEDALEDAGVYLDVDIEDARYVRVMQIGV